MEYLFIGLAAGSIIAYFIFARFNRSKREQNAQQQSVVLMEKIRSVCKFITVEGDFSEIYHYQNVKDKWLNLFLGSKKALVLIDAKAYVGFDLTKIKMHPDVKNRTIILTDFPQPELLSIETDFKYYDKKEGWANPFTSTDLTEINREAKQHIVDKVPQSGLFGEASKQALSTVSLMENLVQTIGWKLDYKALETAAETPKLKEGEDSK
ncbi:MULTISPECIES: DUF4230 domain-containing protein [unclassified Leeuwenhoekiella]|uniref:DUF4230 domain-containing protein n=1 Tax=unclassified Leeuwenhoekiella TaxID=2615029 RepID=UPI000C5B96E8|nr:MULTISPECIES: DUF4230 domain-containing protein [unclassified Leeuwenhoekiella]MBA82496.1 hypothetical protein [Leeuwenhoekiella sp.]|tara:strand:- start:7150 stop:7776 length:627 start_codon:yes stop_codon:yes gene_type:complete